MQNPVKECNNISATLCKRLFIIKQTRGQGFISVGEHLPGLCENLNLRPDTEE